jgi:hypothetical protein
MAPGLLRQDRQRRPRVHEPGRTAAASQRAALAANAETAVLQRYDEELNAAFEQARERGDLTPLLETVHRWRFEADAWRDPEAQREFLARIEKYQREESRPPKSALAGRKSRAVWPLTMYYWDFVPDLPSG